MVSLHFCVENVHFLALEASPHFDWSWGACVNPLDPQMSSVELENKFENSLEDETDASTDPFGGVGKQRGHAKPLNQRIPSVEFENTWTRGNTQSTDPFGGVG